jgi:hypothetical protein
MSASGTDKIRRHLQPAPLALGTVAWAAAMAATAAAALLWTRGWALDGHAGLLTGIFAAGGVLGYPTARLLLALVPGRWSASQRFSSAFILIGAGTVGFTALIFALQFINYYSQWHDDHASKRLLFETVFTILSACYQFLVLGLRLYIPFGLLALIAASWAYAQRRI